MVLEEKLLVSVSETLLYVKSFSYLGFLVLFCRGEMWDEGCLFVFWCYWGLSSGRTLCLLGRVLCHWSQVSGSKCFCYFWERFSTCSLLFLWATIKCSFISLTQSSLLFFFFFYLVLCVLGAHLSFAKVLKINHMDHISTHLPSWFFFFPNPPLLAMISVLVL
jgi:hypothetical protein